MDTDKRLMLTAVLIVMVSIVLGFSAFISFASDHDVVGFVFAITATFVLLLGIHLGLITVNDQD